MGTDPSYFEGPNRPVENKSRGTIARSSALKLTACDPEKSGANSLADRSGMGIRLPRPEPQLITASAVTTMRCQSAPAWYRGTSKGETHPVGELAKNAWGLRQPTSTATSGSGVRTPKPHTRKSHKSTHVKKENQTIIRTFCVAVRGTTRPISVAPRFATGACPRTVTTSAASVCVSAWTDTDSG